MGIFDWMQRRRGEAAPSHDADTAEAVERIVQLTNPRLRLARRYKARLLPAVRTAQQYARTLVTALPPAREASAAAWSADPYIRAFFANGRELAHAFSRSPELCAWFSANPVESEVHALLGMKMVERRTFGVGLEGDVLHRDVPQTSVSFQDYRIRICSGTESGLRTDIERRVVDQLAVAGLAKAAQDASRRKMLEQERALLRIRVQLLEREGTGMGVLSDRSASGDEAARARAALAANEGALASIAAGRDALEHQLECLRETLENAHDYLDVSGKQVCLDRMNVLLPDNTHSGNTLDLPIARVHVPDEAPESRVCVFVRFRRADLVPRTELLGEAGRLLR